MEQYDVKEMQRHLLEMLKEIHRVLTEHGLRYYLVGGTALGAVRHKGFIPWDDDADIGMPRPDYEQFLRCAKDWLPPHYFLRSHVSDPEYPFYYAKMEDLRTTIVEGPARPFVGGVFVDVFPIDGAPSSKKKLLRRQRQFKRYHKLLHFLHRDPYKHGRGAGCWWPLLLRRLYTRREVVEKLNRKISSCGYEDAVTVGVFSPNYITFNDREKVYGKGSLVRFEDTELFTLSDPDTYLRTQYGDYMQVPPPEKRIQHNFLEVSYTDSYLSRLEKK